ncbi:Nucleolar pre-ribosomal-associated protein 1 [Pseudolycoriella hygida]|uniref:Nucleolar pre-ribosomal-associated protein 1 n=1 Tax=Pseudolycoriella hygida TaxID=35572 RepID=A0A9Q0S6E1_9DIPT|nr:Nucleolar pre-ribosomal-associated protein 1 [Pseudolycoriella hygida]
MSASKKANRKRKHTSNWNKNGKVKKICSNQDSGSVIGSDGGTPDQVEHEIIEDNNVEEVEEELKTSGSFNMKIFRTKLKSGNYITELRHFLQEAASNPSLVAKYVNVGGKPLELIEALELIDKMQLFHVSYLFQLTQLVLIEILSNSTQHTQAAVQACSYFLNKHRSLIESLLNSRTSSHRRSVLKLLTAIVALEPTFGREILSTINVVFNPETLKRFTYHTKPEANCSDETVRTCYIHFIMAYLIEGNVMLVRNILDRNELIIAVLSGLVYDSQETVCLVLGTLLKFVLQTLLVSKTKKVQVFNADIIKKLVALFEWKGPAFFTATFDKKNKDNAEKFVNKNELELVSQAAYDFLKVLLCSQKYGIAFQCLGYRLVKKNVVQKEFLLAVKQPWKNTFTGDLAIDVLKACPELSVIVIRFYNIYLDVKKQKAFFEAIDWFCKMVQEMNPKFISRGASNLSASEMILLIQRICMGAEILQKLAIDSRIRNSNIRIRYATIRLLLAMFKQCNYYLLSISKWNIYSQQDMRKIKLEMINHICVCAPSVQQILLSLHMTLVKPGEDGMFEHLEATLDLLLIIAKSIPSFIEASASIMNYIKILQPIYEANRAHESSTKIELKAVKLILTLEPNALSVKTPLFKQIINSFVNVLVLGDSTEQNEAKLLLRNVFLNTGFFENGKLEIDLWLESLKFIDAEALVDVKNFLMKSLTTYDANEVKKLAADQCVGGNNFKNLDELFFNIDNGLALTGFMDIPTLSNFFVHASSKLNEKYDERIAEYLNQVGFFLFHYQPDPKSIQLLMKDTKQPYGKYMKNWVNGKPGKLTEHPLEILVKFYNALLDGTPFPMVFQSESSSVRLRIEGVETQVHPCLNNESQVMIFVYITLFVAVQLNEQKNFDETSSERCTNYLKCLIEILHQLWINSSQETSGGFDAERSENAFVLSLKYIFESHIHLINHFVMWQSTPMTKFVVELTRYVADIAVDRLDDVLHQYRSRITNQVEQLVAKDFDILKLPSQSTEILEILDIFSLKYEHLESVIESIVKLPTATFSGNVIYDILGFVLKRVATLKLKFLTSEQIGSICKIYIIATKQTSDHLMNERFEDAIYNYLKVYYHSIGSVPDELFTAILTCGKQSKLSVKLASLLLERNKKLSDIFIQLLPTLTTKKELIYPLLNVVANGSLKLGTNLLSSMYAEFKNGIMKAIEKPQKAGVIYKENIFSTLFLIEQCMPLNECVDFARKSHKFDSAEVYQLQIIKAIHLKALGTEKREQQEHIFINFINIFSHLFCLLLKNDNPDYAKINGYAVIISQWLNLQKSLPTVHTESYQKIVKSPLWMTISRTCLKMGITTETTDSSSSILLKIFGFLCDSFYSNNCDDDEPAKLYDMALSHSAFFDLVLQRQQSPTKTYLMYTLFVLLQKNASSIKSNHVPVFLGTYQAKLSECDQFILAILQKYERCGIKMHEFKPFMWGESAVSYYSLKDTVSNTNLNQESPSMQIMSLIDITCAEKTLNNFPIWRKLDATEQVPTIKFQFYGIVGNEHMDMPNIAANRLEESVVNNWHDPELLDMSYRSQEIYDDIYDPAFFIPIMSMSFAPEAFTRPVRPAQNGLLAMTFAALSCKDKSVRLATGSALQRYRSHLESSRFIDNNVWLHLFDFVHHGLGELTAEMRKTKKSRIPRVPYVSGVFLAHAVNILMNPLNELYRPISNYITLQSTFPFTDVPEFNVLFNSSDVNHVTYRHFILGVICDGIKCGNDFTLLMSQNIFKAILGFYNTPMATRETNLLILRIINVATKIPKSTKILIEKVGLLPWLSGVVDNVEFFQFDIIDGLCSIFNSVWYSVKFNQNEYTNVSEIEIRLLNILLKLIPNISTRTECAALAKFLNVFSRVIQGNFALITESNLDHLINCGKVHSTDNVLNLGFIKDSDETYAENRISYVKHLRELGVKEKVLFIDFTMREIIIGWLKAKKL